MDAKTNPNIIQHEKIVAYRAWEISPMGYLRSVYMNAVWYPQKGNAPQMEGDPLPPIPFSPTFCDLMWWEGVHAFKFARMAYEDYKGSIFNPFIYGTVRLWGTVIEHENGYRAEFAEIVSLDSISPDTKANRIKLWRLRKKYKLPTGKKPPLLKRIFLRSGFFYLWLMLFLINSTPFIADLLNTKLFNSIDFLNLPFALLAAFFLFKNR